MLQEIFNNFPQLFETDNGVGLVLNELWKLFSLVNGNPDIHYSGIRFSLGIFFSAFLIYVVKMRAVNSWEFRHFAAMIGGCFLLIRSATMFIFLFGYEINLYQDQVLRFLFPPLEHLFGTLAFLCLGFYSIITTRKNHVPLNKKHFFIVPTVLVFYLYVFMAWQDAFFSHYPKEILRYFDSAVDWQSHAVMAIISGVTLTYVYRNVRFCYPILLSYWVLSTLEHLIRTIVFYFRWEPTWLATVFHAVGLWTIPLITLHFVYGYSRKIRHCEACIKMGRLF